MFSPYLREDNGHAIPWREKKSIEIKKHHADSAMNTSSNDDEQIDPRRTGSSFLFLNYN